MMHDILVTHRAFSVTVTTPGGTFAACGQAQRIGAFRSPEEPPAPIGAPTGLRTLSPFTAGRRSGSLRLRFARGAQAGLIPGSTFPQVGRRPARSFNLRASMP